MPLMSLAICLAPPMPPRRSVTFFPEYTTATMPMTQHKISMTRHPTANTSPCSHALLPIERSHAIPNRPEGASAT